MKKRVSVLTNEECLEVGLLITPGWSKILDDLTALGNGQDFPPAVESLGWWELISQLEATQKQRGYKPGWLVHNVLAAGKPPCWALSTVAKIAGYSSKWAARQWHGVFDEYPNVEAIDWKRIAQSQPKIPESLPPGKPILKLDRLTSSPTCKPVLKPRLAGSSIIKPVEGVH